MHTHFQFFSILFSRIYTKDLVSEWSSNLEKCSSNLEKCSRNLEKSVLGIFRRNSRFDPDFLLERKMRLLFAHACSAGKPDITND